jgi:selenophosphate synthase
MGTPLAFKKIKNTLLSYELEIERVKSLIKQKRELMKYHSASMNNREYILAKLDKNNFNTYKIRLMRIKRDLERRLRQILGNYQGSSGKLLYAYFIEEKTIEEIAKENNLDIKVVATEISKRENELDNL